MRRSPPAPHLVVVQPSLRPRNMKKPPASEETGGTRRWARSLPAGFVLLSVTLAGAAVVAVWQTVLREHAGSVNGHDTFAYWSVNAADPYHNAIAPTRGAFLYSPAMAQLMSPLGLLPWEVVRTGWAIIQVALLTVLAGPLAAIVAITPPVWQELLLGNVSFLLAAVAVFGLRWPALWSIAILMKLTPGVGLLWFVARGEWRRFTIAAGTTGVIALVSFVIAPSLWFEWAGVLFANRGVSTDLPTMPPAPLRLAVAAVLVWFGARRGYAWLVPIAVTLSMGHLWVSTLSIAVGALWGINPVRWRPATLS